MLLGLAGMANRERELVLQHFEERTVSSKLVEQLLADAGRLIDCARAGQEEYVRAAQRQVAFSWRFRFAHFLHRRFGLEGPLVDALADRFESLLVNRIVLEELAPFIDDKLASLVGEAITPRLHQIVNQRQEMTRAALEALRMQYPDYASLLERRVLIRIALRRQDQEYRALFDEGVIGPELYGPAWRGRVGARHGRGTATPGSGPGSPRPHQQGEDVWRCQPHRSATGPGGAVAEAPLRAAR
jgi:CPA1 family monovalent cation:H+ antiporter